MRRRAGTAYTLLADITNPSVPVSVLLHVILEEKRVV